MDSLLIIKLIGVPVIFLLGSLFHFIYKYGGRKKWMVIISPVNESLWEHLKIGFYPFLLVSFFQFLLFSELPRNILSADFVGVFVVLGFILISELIYPAILKRNILFIDLLIFFIAILIGQLVSYFILQSYPDFYIMNELLILIFLFTASIFALFSFRPPRFGIFKDSVDGKYGVK